MATTTYKITSGPDSLHLLLAVTSMFKDGSAPDVTYETSTGPITLQLNGIAREDGSGKSWLLDGFLAHGKRMTGYYHAERRAGRLRAG